MRESGFDDWLDAIQQTLEYDERLIYKSMYDKTPWLYDRVNGVAVVVRNRLHGVVDWEWDAIFHTQTEEHDEWEFVCIMMHVRLRTPVREGVPSELISPEEYARRTNQYRVLDVYCSVVRADLPYRVDLVRASVYRANKDIYQLVGVKYAVVHRYKGALL